MPCNYKKKHNAKMYAKKMRSKGYQCGVYKKKGGYGVSVKRK